MIKLKEVYLKESKSFIDTEIHFTYNGSYGIYTIVEYKPTKEIAHFITYNMNTHSNSRFIPKSEITDTDFIKAFNQYFDYKITL